MSQSRIIADTSYRYDPAESSWDLLELLMDANIDDHDEVYSDDEESTARIHMAKDKLRLLTTAWRTERALP